MKSELCGGDKGLVALMLDSCPPKQSQRARGRMRKRQKRTPIPWISWASKQSRWLPS